MDKQPQKRSDESFRHEYDQVNDYIRHYSNLRFAVFSVFVALTAALGFAAFNAQDLRPIASAFAAAGGVVFTVAFYLFDERISQMFDHFSEVARNLDKELGYKQIEHRPKGCRPIPPAKTVMRCIFAFVGLFWGFWPIWLIVVG